MANEEGMESPDLAAQTGESTGRPAKAAPIKTLKPMGGMHDDDVEPEEMARLLSGTPDSNNARAHAAEMLNSANQWRGENG